MCISSGNVSWGNVSIVAGVARENPSVERRRDFLRGGTPGRLDAFRTLSSFYASRSPPKRRRGARAMAPASEDATFWKKKKGPEKVSVLRVFFAPKKERVRETSSPNPKKSLLKERESPRHSAVPQSDSDLGEFQRLAQCVSFQKHDPSSSIDTTQTLSNTKRRVLRCP